jgi:hypothetical protein
LWIHPNTNELGITLLIRLLAKIENLA